MQAIAFESAIVERTSDGTLLIALFAGPLSDRTSPPACVGLFVCDTDAANALRAALGSALKRQEN